MNFQSALRGWLRFCLCCVFTVVILGSLLPNASASRADFYVATNGNDGWTGKLDSPNFTRTDGPFATLAHARDAVREFKKSTRKKDILVQVRGGVYPLKETLVFSLADSAAKHGSISYSAFPNERPTISSGVPIRDWKKLEHDLPNLPAGAHGKLWVADLPKNFQRVFTLYDGAERLPRARGAGFAPTNFADATSLNKFIFPTGALRNWSDLKEGEIVIIPTADYEMGVLPLAEVDELAHIATTTQPASRRIGKVKFFEMSAWVENVAAVLDQPGEWIVNTAERKIYLWPRNDRPSESIVAPFLTELIRVEGEIDYDGGKDKPIRGIRFSGFTFSHAERFQWHGQTGWSLQHHWEMFDRPTAALRFRGAENCEVRACQIASTSGAGIRLDLHCQKNRIINNEISHVGGVGILLAGYGPGTKDVNRKNEVSNNWIHHTGEIYWATPALMVWQSSENHIANNLIHNTPYSGITVSTRSAWVTTNTTADGSRTVRWREVGDPKKSLGWYEREKFLHSRKNVVERNEIHDVMEVLGDGNGIYISGTGKENLIRENYIHDTLSDHASGPIRCDDFQEETIIEENIIVHERAVCPGITSKGKNHIINNVIVDMLRSRQVIRPEWVVHGYIGLTVNPVTGSRVERNILVSKRSDSPIYIERRIYGQGGEPRLRECIADRNLYFCTEDSEWGAKHLAQARQFGIEKRSLAADPMFLNLEERDFRFQPNSPALKLGIKPVELSRIGLRPNHPFIAKPVELSH